VPFSLHSSFEELRAFIAQVKPRKLKPIVGRQHTDVSYFTRYLDPSPRTKVEIPKEIYDDTNEFYRKTKLEAQEPEDFVVDPLDEQPRKKIKPNEIINEDEPPLPPFATAYDDDDSQNLFDNGIFSHPSQDQTWIDESRTLLKHFYGIQEEFPL
jgi:hypothetical protein